MTPGNEYQVLAVSAAGEIEWALRAAGRAQPSSADERQAWLAPLRERFPHVVRFEVDWPDRKPVLASLRVDGHGHLYVYPFVVGATRTSEVPVDVYAADGTSPLGYVVTGRNDAYDLELRKPQGTVHLRRDLPQIALEAEERAEWEAFRQTVIDSARAANRDPAYDPDPVPEVKPFFRDVFVGDDGRIWVFRFVAAEKRDDVEPLPDRPERPLLTWREPWTYDVFEPDGTFLGSVVVPELLEPLVFRGERIWGALVDAEGVERVVRLRVVPEGQ